MGTVTLVVEDENDNIPMLPSKGMSLCEREGHLGSVVIKAFDPDSSPFGAPFLFTLPKDNDGNWALTNVNGERVCRPL